MDLVFTSSDFQNILAEVTVTHPFPAELRKKTRYSCAARQRNHNFIPFAFETFGASRPSFAVS